MGLGGLLGRDGPDDDRDGEHQDECHEEHGRPRDVGGDDTAGEHAQQHGQLEGRGRETQIGFLVLLGQVLGDVDDVQGFRAGQAGGLDEPAGEHHRPDTVEEEPDERADTHQSHADDEQGADTHAVGQGGVDHGTNADDDSGQACLQGCRVLRQVQVVGDGGGHELETVVDHEAQHEGGEHDRYGGLGIDVPVAGGGRVVRSFVTTRLHGDNVHNPDGDQGFV